MTTATPHYTQLNENQPHWFSDNPDRAWTEKFFLLYSPIWMLFMAIMMVTGWDKSFSDSALLLHSLLVATPLLLIPALLRSGQNPNDSWLNSYWLKANLYMILFSVFGNYVGSEYFFDVLGMVYHYPNASSTLDAAIVGQGEQQVPLIMYFYTHAYFITYHTTAVMVLRRFMTSQLPARILLFLPMSFLVGYCWAWIETKAMANPLMASSFYYSDMNAMLTYGSFIYATYFIVSFPIFYFLDEPPQQRWNLTKTASAALSASMLVFYLLDASAHWVGSIS
jgi:cycloeucalenol cycloisomerase